MPQPVSHAGAAPGTGRGSRAGRREPWRPWHEFVFVLCVLVVLAGLATAGSRLFSSDTHTPFVEFAVAVPLVAPALLLATFGAWLLRRRRLTVVAAVLALVHLVLLAPAMGLGVGRPASTAGAQEITVMTLNTLTGLADPAQIIRTVRERNVDVLALEEYTPTLAVELRRSGLTALLPYEAGRTDWGGGGTTLWSRFPTAYVGEVPGTEFTMPQRSIRLANGATVTFTAVHTLSPIPGRVQAWRADLLALHAALGRARGTQVVLGDFNATRDHAAFRALLEGPSGLTDASESVGLLGGGWPGFTFPANKPGVPLFMRLDHVLVSPTTVAVRSLDVVPIADTDHRGLIVRLAVLP